MQFYSKVYAEDCGDPCLLDLQHHLPKYFGTWSSPEYPNELYLKLEDVNRRFQKPCIMDVKIGQKSYDPYASHEKRDQQIKKYPLMEEVGFLLLRMRSQLTFYASSLLFVYEGLPPPSPEGHVFRGPPEKTTSTADACCEPNEEVLEYNNNIRVAVPLDYSLSTMYTMYKKGCTRGHHGKVTATGITTTGPNPQEDNSTWKCPGLVPAEQPNGNGIKAKLEEEFGVGEGGRGEPHPDEVEVRMIDFAHVFPSESQDQGYIYGLKHLLEVLQQILHQ
ncbi:unnamed protein product [Coregonus sp. 'balchen']|nr:unnamed protein product [Coregonus sp. 'balchen']